VRLVTFLCAAVAIAAAAGCTGPAQSGPAAVPPSAATAASAPAQEPVARTVDLQSAGDEFTDAGSLPGWSVFHGDLTDEQAGTIDVGATTPGALTIAPGRASWVDRSRGFYLYKQVEGDFMVTLRVKATGRSGSLPTVDWSLTGLLLRAPTAQPRSENWIGHTVGFVSQPTIERKTTRESRSVLRLSPVPAGWIELRAVRSGRLFALLHRVPGQPWQLDGAYSRADLPRTLQVGINAQTGYESPVADLTATLDWIRFKPTGIPAAAGDQLLTQIAVAGRFDDGYAASAPELELIRKHLLPYLTA